MRGLCASLLVLFGCGSVGSPVVDGDDGSSTTSEGRTDEATSSSSSATSETTTGLDGPSPTSSGASSSSTGEPLEGLCLQGKPLPELEGFESILSTTDLDADGHDEVWLSRAEWNPATAEHTSRIRVVEFDTLANPEVVAEAAVDDTVEALLDIDGDGAMDAITERWDQNGQWWQAGTKDLGFAGPVHPLVPPSSSGTWLDVTGDSRADFIELFLGDTLTVHVGTGTGSTTPAGSTTVPETSARSVLEVPGLDQFVFAFDIPDTSIGLGPSILQVATVSADGDVDVISSSPELVIRPIHVEDVDGDGVADVLGRSSIGPTWNLIQASSAQGLSAVTLAEGLDGAMVGRFVDGAAQLVLGEREDGTFVLIDLELPDAPRDVQGSENWSPYGLRAVLEADGRPGDEVLTHVAPRGQLTTWALWRVVRC